MSSLPLQFLLLTVAGWMTRDQRLVTEYLLAENKVLRQQLRGRRIRYTDAQRRRLALAAIRVGRKALLRIDTLVTPDTLLRWYRRLVAKKYDSSGRGRTRPRRTMDIAELVLRMARDNSGWGYTRIRGALSNLGHDVGRSTIKRILIEAGFDPAPERSKRSSWSSFLRAHWGAIAAMDFFTVEVVSLVGLVRYHVLFVIDLASRRVELAGLVHEPHEAWMKQAARNLTDRVDGFLLGKRYVIMDRDPLFTDAFRAMLATAGTKSVRLPPRSPTRVRVVSPRRLLETRISHAPHAGSSRPRVDLRTPSADNACPSWLWNSGMQCPGSAAGSLPRVYSGVFDWAQAVDPRCLRM